jgi:hypothetical protein
MEHGQNRLNSIDCVIRVSSVFNPWLGILPFGFPPLTFFILKRAFRRVNRERDRL